MSEYFINISLQFREELERIYFYISYVLSSPHTANKLYFKVKESVLSLNLFPERYSKILITNYSNHNLRKMVVNNYIIIYEVNNVSFQVSILHIFHSSQNYLDRL